MHHVEGCQGKGIAEGITVPAQSLQPDPAQAPRRNPPLKTERAGPFALLTETGQRRLPDGDPANPWGEEICSNAGGKADDPVHWWIIRDPPDGPDGLPRTAGGRPAATKWRALYKTLGVTPAMAASQTEQATGFLTEPNNAWG